jgi:hypothetical protein
MAAAGAALLTSLIAPGPAHAITGGTIELPALENGQPDATKRERIALSSFSWRGAAKEDLNQDDNVNNVYALDRLPPRNGQPGTLVIAKRVATPSSGLALYCKHKTHLKDVTVDAPNWADQAPGRSEGHRTFRLHDVVVEACGHNPGAVAEIFHLAFAAIEWIGDGTPAQGAGSSSRK